jgi:glyoxylase-like metal-dependent hydrolase (beta-lactamase superfamily II)/ferredoxin
MNPSERSHLATRAREMTRSVRTVLYELYEQVARSFDSSKDRRQTAATKEKAHFKVDVDLKHSNTMMQILLSSLLIQQLLISDMVAGFVSPFGLPSKQHQQHTSIRLWAQKPVRLPENAEGIVYVNELCINCEACAGFAPATFGCNQNIQKHVVHTQPTSAGELAQARAAMAACPVAAIRLDTKTTVKDDSAIVQSMSRSKEAPGQTFPRPLFQDETNTSNQPAVPSVYWTGHHNAASFGAVPFLVQATHQGQSVWIMVDCPKFPPKAAADICAVTGPSGPHYLVLTHTDDTADHEKWAQYFEGHLQEIFHAGDLGRYNWLQDASLEDVDILLQPPSDQDDEDDDRQHLVAYSLDGDMLPSNWPEQWKAGTILPDSNVVLLHTPGHSPGSIALYKRPEKQANNNSPGILFTGDTYAWTEVEGGRMTGFGPYGYDPDAKVHIRTLSQLLQLEWDVVAAGHGHSRDYRGDKDDNNKRMELKQAQDDLVPFVGWSKQKKKQ